jgi:hypothetical protein
VENRIVDSELMSIIRTRSQERMVEQAEEAAILAATQA